MDWLEKRLPPPTFSEVVRRHIDWDYAQADALDWTTEPFAHRFADALRLWRTEPEKAFTLIHILAEEGSPGAMEFLAESYTWGRTVGVDLIEGESWFRRAFEKGSKRAMLSYGRLHMRFRDWEEAEAVFQPGADEGWAPACYWLARTLIAHSRNRKTRQRARRLLERAADAGSPGTQQDLAALMAIGFFGLKEVRHGWRLLDEKKPPPRQTAEGETIH